jgi:hypothetical protein
MVVLIIYGPKRDSMELGSPWYRKLIGSLDQFWLSGRMLAVRRGNRISSIALTEKLLCKRLLCTFCNLVRLAESHSPR